MVFILAYKENILDEVNKQIQLVQRLFHNVCITANNPAQYPVSGAMARRFVEEAEKLRRMLPSDGMDAQLGTQLPFGYEEADTDK